MTYRFDVASGRDVLVRWCELAEARLEYLTELFETGRWRRYHSEIAFLENIREAKTAVEIWRDLSRREANRDNSAFDISWLGQPQTRASRHDGSRDQMYRRPPKPVEPPPSMVPAMMETEQVYADEATSAPESSDASVIEPLSAAA